MYFMEAFILWKKDDLPRIRPKAKESVTRCKVADLLSAIAKITTNLRHFRLLHSTPQRGILAR